jgi:hypothetical protein
MVEGTNPCEIDILVGMPFNPTDKNGNYTMWPPSG